MPDYNAIFQKLVSKLTSWLEGVIIMLPNALLALAVASLVALASRLFSRFVEQLIFKLSKNEPISSLLGTLARVTAIALGVFFALSLLNLDKTVTSLLAGVGIAGLALGFAFQDIASNFMSGFIMALNRPFVVGDLVKVSSGHFGHVKRVAMRASLIETLEGLSVLIPNKDIFQNPIVNYTNTPYRRMDLVMGTAYGDDMSTVRRVVCEAVQAIPHRDPKRDVEFFFQEFGDSSINFSVRIWLTRSAELSYLEARSEAMIAIKRALDKNALTIPFPIRTLDFGADAIGGERLDAMRLRVVDDRATGT